MFCRSLFSLLSAQRGARQDNASTISRSFPEAAHSLNRGRPSPRALSLLHYTLAPQSFTSLNFASYAIFHLRDLLLIRIYQLIIA
jgi:hypothetical protein